MSASPGWLARAGRGAQPEPGPQAIVSHDPAVAERVDRVLQLVDGEVTEA